MEPHPVNPPSAAVPKTTKSVHFVTQPTKAQAPASEDGTINAIIIETIPVYCCPWRGYMLLRRIDSDYINVTILCRALGKPELEPAFRGLPGAVVVGGKRHPVVDEMVNGTWVHLFSVAAGITLLGMPEDLVNTFLHNGLASRFPGISETISAYRAMQKGQHRFGPPFAHLLGRPRTTSHRMPNVGADDSQNARRGVALTAMTGHHPHNSELKAGQPATQKRVVQVYSVEAADAASLESRKAYGNAAP